MLRRQNSWSDNLVAYPSNAASTQHGNFQPQRLPSGNSKLTAILEKPQSESSDSTCPPRKKHVLRRSSTAYSLTTPTSAKSDDSVFFSETSTPRTDSNSGTTRNNASIRKDSGNSSRRDSGNSRKDSGVSRRDSGEGTRRPSFGNIGCKVTGLLRARNAFRRVKKKLADVVEEEVMEEIVVIREMPRYPRFASMLSPEAQFATMMGYEDIVYNRLTVNYPEYRPMLRRNRTPSTGVEVTCEQTVNTKKPVETGSDNTHANTTLDPEDTSASNNKNVRKSASIKHFLTASATSTSMPLINVQPPTFSRSKSLPYVLPAERQLVLTDRYQKAMDIYDSLRRHDGVNTLSPRIKPTHNNTRPPINEFNSWSTVWKREFKAKSRTASV